MQKPTQISGEFTTGAEGFRTDRLKIPGGFLYITGYMGSSKCAITQTFVPDDTDTDWVSLKEQLPPQGKSCLIYTEEEHEDGLKEPKIDFGSLEPYVGGLRILRTHYEPLGINTDIPVWWKRVRLPNGVMLEDT